MNVVLFFFILGLSISECSDLNDNFECQTRCEDENASPQSDFVPSILNEGNLAGKRAGKSLKKGAKNVWKLK